VQCLMCHGVGCTCTSNFAKCVKNSNLAVFIAI